MIEPLPEAQIREYLTSKQAIVAAYLSGSAATGQAHASSDLDFALLLDEGLDEASAFNPRLEAMDDLARMARCPVDIVLLNQAPPFCCFSRFFGTVA